jgi:hypothetical protein
LAGPETGWFNRTGYRNWWYGCNVDGTLTAYGYMPRITGDPPS